MIKYIKAININRRVSIEANFENDVNIITGINGVGKTTLLKLIWFLNSCNIERIFDDAVFDYLECNSTYFNIKISVIQSKGKIEQIEINYNDEKHPDLVKKCTMENFNQQAEEINKITFDFYKNVTVMFPTFRRIEGGYSYLSNQNRKQTRLQYGQNLQHALETISEHLGVGQHKFVTSISTRDVKELLTSAYAFISRNTNVMHSKLSSTVDNIIRKNGGVDEINDLGKAKEILNEVDRKIKEINTKQTELLRPFTSISNIIKQIYNGKGVKVSEGIYLGDQSDSIDSDILSSGEKQMLSFLSYNAFIHNGVILIDEPELSLHIDWQRQLIQILTEQNPSNQFLIATHSPYIFEKYADKEIILGK